VTKIFVLHTSTHAPKESSSSALARFAVGRMRELVPNAEVRAVDAEKLHIVQNLSCYANGKTHCADPKSGKYRCWANYLSQKDPKAYGGKDEMGVIYDHLAWADVVVFTTSNRWGSRSALAQKIIERMNTLENRAVSYGEPYPLKGKRLGILVTGLHWHTGRVGFELLEALRWFGFATQPDESNVLAWQRSRDPYFEHPNNDKPYVERWAEGPEGQEAIDRWARAVVSSSRVVV
jgi:multimeric flavodoxin WrbA